MFAAAAAKGILFLEGANNPRNIPNAVFLVRYVLKVVIEGDEDGRFVRVVASLNASRLLLTCCV